MNYIMWNNAVLYIYWCMINCMKNQVIREEISHITSLSHKLLYLRCYALWGSILWYISIITLFLHMWTCVVQCVLCANCKNFHCKFKVTHDKTRNLHISIHETCIDMTQNLAVEPTKMITFQWSHNIVTLVSM